MARFFAGARELHDTTAHTLSGISVNLEALKTIAPKDNPEMIEMIDISLSAARTGLSETRRALHDLRAQPLEDLGLELALKQLVDSAIERADLKAIVDIDSPLHLPPNVEQVFYRVAQEALENVVRHANATELVFTLHLRDDVLQLIVFDNGQGFEEEAVEGHYGMQGMRERALTIGATLSIISHPGEHTQVGLTWERFL